MPVRSGKDFRLYNLQPGVPIRAPRDFDLDAALARATAVVASDASAVPDIEGDWLEGELPDLTDSEGDKDVEEMEDLEDPEDPLSQPPSNIPSFPSQHSNSASPSAAEAPNAVDTSHLTPEEKKRLRRQRKTERKRGRRNVERKAVQTKLKTRAKGVSRRRAAASSTIEVDPSFSTESLPSSSTGWSGIRQTLEKLVPSMRSVLGTEFEMQLVNWNGRDSIAVVDRDGCVIAVLAGRPRGGNWEELIQELTEKVTEARSKMRFSVKQKKGARGNFTTAAIGTSFGGGSMQPGTMAWYSAINRLTLLSLVAMAGMQALIGFANCMFQAFAGNTFSFYQENLDSLYQSDSRLTRWFRGVFASISINFGPITVCWPHTDSHNLAFGWCAITALGNFDPDRGGHLILWDLGLVIRFPPGSTILIPSALLTHSNLSVQSNEFRYSVVQYTSSGLFRWVYNLFKSDRSFMAGATAEEKKQRTQDAKLRWRNGVNMFSLWNDVVAAGSAS